MKSHFDVLLVCLSLFVAVFSSYTALNMAGRTNASKGVRSRLWLLGGALSMGVGIWSMHFIGMLALQLPMPMRYDPIMTVASLLIAMSSSAAAFWLVGRQRLGRITLCAGAVLMGSGVALMHYTGMAAMKGQLNATYDSAIVLASILIAIVASGAALWLVFRLRLDPAHAFLYRISAAMLMGIAVAGMHYTGMAAVHYGRGAMAMPVGESGAARVGSRGSFSSEPPA